MSVIKLGTYGGQTRFNPGAPIAGKVLWMVDEPGPEIEVRLVWYADGKGRDCRAVRSHRLEATPETGGGEFRFDAPVAPYSYHGVLFSVNWALEAGVVETGAASFPAQPGDVIPITISPNGDTVRAPVLENGDPLIEGIDAPDVGDVVDPSRR